MTYTECLLFCSILTCNGVAFTTIVLKEADTKDKITQTLIGEALFSNATSFGFFYVIWSEFIIVEKVNAAGVIKIVALQSIAGTAVGVFFGYVLKVVLNRMKMNKQAETHLFVVTPFLLYYLCDNKMFDLNGVFALVALGLMFTSLRFTLHHREEMLPA